MLFTWLKLSNNRKPFLVSFSFVADQNSDFYQSQKFQKVLNFVQSNPNLCRLKEKETKNGLRLLLSFNQVKSIDKALSLINKID